MRLVAALFAVCVAHSPPPDAGGASWGAESAPAGAPDSSLAVLAAAMRARIAAVPGAAVAVYYRGARGDTVTIAADSVFHAASTMKLAVMIRLFRDVDAGRLSLDRAVPVTNAFTSIADGSTFATDLKDDSDSSLYARVGTAVPVRTLLALMIQRSSNLATNTLIALVGAARVDSTDRALGAPTMRVLRGVEDGPAFARGLNNTVTARDLATLLAAVATDHAASPASCRAMREVLLGQEFNTEIPAGLPAGTRVAHKTGQITGILHDAAIVYPATSAPYLLVVLTRGIPDEHVAQSLIADLSRLVYAHHEAAGQPR